MREVYRDEFCRLIQYDNAEVGSRAKEYKLVSLDSDYLPPHWPTPNDMRTSLTEIDKLRYVF